MNCPQCGSDGYNQGKECRVCGFNADQAEEKLAVAVPMKDTQRDLMNGVGLGCSVLAIIWFFVETLVFILASRDAATWSTYGPIVSVTVPIILVLIFYLILRRKPSDFSRGVGYSLLITLVFALLFAIVSSKHDNKPPANAAHSEGF